MYVTSRRIGLDMNVYLLKRLIVRDIKDKYRGSVLGFLWSLLKPLLVLCLYAFFFDVLFQRKWVSAESGDIPYAMIIYSGLLLVECITEVSGRSVDIIRGNVNYVKKIIFPLTYFPVVITVSAMVQAMISFVILVAVQSFLSGFSFFMLEGFLIFIPLFFLALGVSLLISALSVYLRDMSNVVVLISSFLVYVSPVLFSVSELPSGFQKLLYINPLTYLIENVRYTVLYHGGMNWHYYLVSVLFGFGFYCVGRTVFNRLKKGFCDVL